MPVLLDLERVINSRFDEGRERFGDLGLNLETYIARIQSIVQKNLGLSPASDAVVAFVIECCMVEICIWEPHVLRRAFASQRATAKGSILAWHGERWSANTRHLSMILRVFFSPAGSGSGPCGQYAC